MPKAAPPTQWSQPSLIPVHWPIVELRARWIIPASDGVTMVRYDVTGASTTDTLLAKGIDWCHNIHDPAQTAELHHDLIRRALEHLAPF